MHPLRGDWMMRLDEAIGELEAREAAPQVALVAHSLGCQLVAAWAAHSRKTAPRARRAAGGAARRRARRGARARCTRSRRSCAQRLPFPSLAVISTRRPVLRPGARPRDGRRLGRAACWSVGARGHLNSDSGLGDWPEGPLPICWPR